MLNVLVHKTTQQLCGYKTVYFYNLYRNNIFKNPIRFIKVTNTHWNASIRWAYKIKKND